MTSSDTGTSSIRACSLRSLHGLQKVGCSAVPGQNGRCNPAKINREVRGTCSFRPVKVLWMKQVRDVVPFWKALLNSVQWRWGWSLIYAATCRQIFPAPGTGLSSRTLTHALSLSLARSRSRELPVVCFPFCADVIHSVTGSDDVIHWRSSLRFYLPWVGSSFDCIDRRLQFHSRSWPTKCG